MTSSSRRDFLRSAAAAGLFATGIAPLAAGDAYTAHFPAKTANLQAKIIAAVLKVANSKAGLNTSADGICAVFTVEWIVKSHEKNSPQEGFDELMKEDPKTPKGLAFWTQMCGAFKAYYEAEAGGVFGTKVVEQLSTVTHILSNKKLSLTEKRADNATAAVNSVHTGGPYFDLSLQQLTGGGAHDVGLFRESGGVVLMDPNYGIAPVTAAATIIPQLFTHYGAKWCAVYEAK
jgi:hypothetical protein